MINPAVCLIAVDARPEPSPYTLVAFAAYMIGVFLLGVLSHQLLKRGSFLKEYFLGDRQLNAWVLSLTYVATSVSAGSFVGFPSFIYRHGWVMAFWIGGYMIAGLVKSRGFPAPSPCRMCFVIVFKALPWDCSAEFFS